jgi:AbrB family looped-hinge helix DNA binding protein
MSEVLYMDKGRVTIPEECRQRLGLKDGSAFLLLETKSGALVLKSAKAKPELSIVEHLKGFKGLEIPKTKFHCAPRL